MNVFISWSGDRSGAVASLLKEWLKCVIQSSKPWVSSKDIDRGALWFDAIGDQLKDTTFGIICLTAENKDRPWILFEAGALAKGLATNRVCTFLIDLDPADITDPLAQFNHTLPSKESFYQLIATLNKSLGSELALPAATLEKVFNTYWPQFESGFQKALSDYPAGAKPKKRDEKDMLSEILEGVRGLSHRVAKLEESKSDRHVGLMAAVKNAEIEKSNLNRFAEFLAASEAARNQSDDFIKAVKEIRALNSKPAT
jgi:hypothetical protein